MYTTLAAWLSYAADRGDTAVADAQANDQSAALQRADDYIRRAYVNRFSTHVDLADATVAGEAAEAVHLAALLELAKPNFFTQTYTAAELKTLTKLGELQWTPLSQGRGQGEGWGGEGGSSGDAAQPRCTAIEALLGPYMASATRPVDATRPTMGALLI